MAENRAHFAEPVSLRMVASVATQGVYNRVMIINDNAVRGEGALQGGNQLHSLFHARVHHTQGRHHRLFSSNAREKTNRGLPVAKTRWREDGSNERPNPTQDTLGTVGLHSTWQHGQHPQQADHQENHGSSPNQKTRYVVPHVPYDIADRWYAVWRKLHQEMGHFPLNRVFPKILPMSRATRIPRT